MKEKLLWKRIRQSRHGFQRRFFLISIPSVGILAAIVGRENGALILWSLQESKTQDVHHVHELARHKSHRMG
jgi:hypothetical protein